MTTSDPTGYPFPDDSIRAHARDRERPVCGGFTSIEWNQRQTRDIAFTCSHGCGWQISMGGTHSTHIVVIFEIDYADQLHRDYAWKRLGESTDGPTDG